MSKELLALQGEIRAKEDKKKAALLQRFFKTGKGEYAEGDVFLGIIVPASRKIAKGYYALSCADTEELLRSRIHEERFIALLILMERFRKGAEVERKKVYALYMKNKSSVNNWDLVDMSAPHIVGGYLCDKDRSELYALAGSKTLWDRRIAIMATLFFIRQGEFGDTLRLADMLMSDTHDLMHKAVGWMLREVGNKDMSAEKDFLKTRYKKMPRTMLRYAIEKFPERERKAYLRGDA